MGEKSGLKAMMPSKKEIGFMVIEGFGLFLTVTGMVRTSNILCFSTIPLPLSSFASDSALSAAPWTLSPRQPLNP